MPGDQAHAFVAVRVGRSPETAVLQASRSRSPSPSPAAAPSLPAHAAPPHVASLERLRAVGRPPLCSPSGAQTKLWQKRSACVHHANPTVSLCTIHTSVTTCHYQSPCAGGDCCNFSSACAIDALLHVGVCEHTAHNRRAIMRYCAFAWHVHDSAMQALARV